MSTEDGPEAGSELDDERHALSQEARHHSFNNYLFADGHAELSRWDKLTWGQLDAAIPDSDPDYNVSLTTLPSKTWPGT